MSPAGGGRGWNKIIRDRFSTILRDHIPLTLHLYVTFFSFTKFRKKSIPPFLTNRTVIFLILQF
jgi:hypothetical protein